MIWKSTTAIFLFCCSVLSLKAQSNQWQDLMLLKPGAQISIVTRGRQDCELVSVTDSELTCIGDVRLQSRRLVYARDQVRQRKEHGRVGETHPHVAQCIECGICFRLFARFGKRA